MNKFILDTSILLGYIRGNELYKKIEEELILTDEKNVVLISVASNAELLSLGIQNNWGDAKLNSLQKLLTKIPIIGINHSDEKLLEIYAEIDAYSLNKLPNKKRNSSKTMGKNDLWIASTAYVTDSILVTTDKDFDHLDPEYIKVKRFNP